MSVQIATRSDYRTRLRTMPIEEVQYRARNGDCNAKAELFRRNKPLTYANLQRSELA